MLEPSTFRATGGDFHTARCTAVVFSLPVSTLSNFFRSLPSRFSLCHASLMLVSRVGNVKVLLLMLWPPKSTYACTGIFSIGTVMVMRPTTFNVLRNSSPAPPLFFFSSRKDFCVLAR